MAILTIRVPPEMLSRAGDLAVDEFKLRGLSVSRATIIRAAIEKGLTALALELAPGPPREPTAEGNDR